MGFSWRGTPSSISPICHRLASHACTYIFFLMVVLCFASMGIRSPGPGGAAAARNGFALRSPRVGYGLPTAGELRLGWAH